MNRQADHGPLPPIARTKTEVALQTLRAALVQGDIRPGERLYVGKLSKELGMSPTPVREAIRTLQAEGLITHEPHRTGSAATLEASDIEELYMLRALLEGKATELAAARFGDGELERLEGLQVELVAAFRADDMQRFTQTNADWHFALYTAARSRWLSEFIVRLWVRVPWDRTWVEPGRCQRSVDEHVAIMSALKDRRAEEAGLLMSRHVISGSESLLDLMAHGGALD